MALASGTLTLWNFMNGLQPTISSFHSWKCWILGENLFEMKCQWITNNQTRVSNSVRNVFRNPLKKTVVLRERVPASQNKNMKPGAYPVNSLRRNSFPPRSSSYGNDGAFHLEKSEDIVAVQEIISRNENRQIYTITMKAAKQEWRGRRKNG